MQIPGFKKEKVLGEGSYGKVYKTTRLNDHQTYALKVIDLFKLSEREIHDAVNEIRLMASITSPFIISFYEALPVDDQKRLCIVTEYAKLGDLSHLIERRKLRNRPLQEEQVWQFLLEILEGLRILHSCGVVHRDIKSANILLSAPDLVKIADLGIATVLHKHKYPHYKEMAKTQIGTPYYLAPEIWKNLPYDQKCDMWSLGVVLYEMLTFSFPFLGRNQSDLQRRICAGAYQIPRYTERLYSYQLISIMRHLLNVNPQERPSVEELLDLQCVKEHMDLLNPFLQTDLFRCSSMNDIIFEGGKAKLLSTIRVPRAKYDRYGRRNVNLEEVQLPSEKYNKRPPVIIPIEDRIQMKKDAPLPSSLNIATLSTPDLTLIADLDYWVPNKEIKPSYSELKIGSDAYLPQVEPNENEMANANFNVYNARPSPRKQHQNNDAQFEQQQQVPQQIRQSRLDDDSNLYANIRPSPRKCYQQDDNQHFEHNPQVQNPVYHVDPPKVSPRIIPTRYRCLWKPCKNDLYQDPRWKRKQPSIKQPQRPAFNNHVNYNNIFNKQQQDVPWWYGQELQRQQPPQIHQRKPAMAANPRFRRF